MRSTDSQEGHSGLGKPIRKEPEPIAPKQIKPGVFQGADGRLSTSIPTKGPEHPPVPQNIFEYFYGSANESNS